MKKVEMRAAGLALPKRTEESRFERPMAERESTKRKTVYELSFVVQ